MMKIKPILLLLVLLVPMLVSAAGDWEAGMDQTTLERLEILCKMWGNIRYFHPYLAAGDIDWDQALVKTYPKVKQAASPEEFRQALDHMLSFLNDPATCIDCRVEKDNSQRDPIVPGPEQPKLKWLDKTTALVVANDNEAMSRKGSNRVLAKFKEIIKECRRADYVIFDLRSVSPDVNMRVAYRLPYYFSELVSRELVLPAHSFVTHLGNQGSYHASRAYHSGLKTIAGGIITPGAKPGTKTPRMAFLMDGGSVLTSGISDFPGLLMALQRENLAVVVYEGPLNPAIGIDMDYFSISKDLGVHIRLSRRQWKGRAVNFTPDFHVKENGLETALRAVKGEIQTNTPAGDKNRLGSPLTGDPYYDRLYAAMDYPTEAYRVLALFRFWNTIEYFFPYKDLMDQDWSASLKEYLPQFIGAAGSREYALAITGISTRIHDSHVAIDSRHFKYYIGRYRPPIRVGFIQGKTVVTELSGALKKKFQGLRVGDILFAVDGEEVEQKRKRLAAVLSASTPGRLNSLIDQRLLLGKENSQCSLKAVSASGKIKIVTYKRIVGGAAKEGLPLEHPVYDILPEGYGYVDMDRLLDHQVTAAFEKVKTTPGLILDMRGYFASGTHRFMRRHLLKEKVPTAQFKWPYYERRGRLREFITYSYAVPQPGEKYEGQIVVLINEEAQSAAEQICLELAQVPGIRFVGSPTSGANGMVSYVVLPGNVSLRFTGVAVMHPDGGQLQRKGIQPDVPVEPTIAGIRAGRDELLEKAVEALNRQLKK